MRSFNANPLTASSPEPAGKVDCEVLVVGGGPAGSTIAALLAERGRHVVLVEKDEHPRFHIGESLLPLNLPLFERLGLKDRIEKFGMFKYGVEFVSPYHKRSETFDFANAWDKRFPYSYQVRRSEFDHLLFRNAIDKGVEVFERCRVTAVDFPDAGGATVHAHDVSGNTRQWRARFLVDASGRDTLVAGQLGIRQRSRKHNSAAIFGHFVDARRLPGKAEGNITIFWFDHGWFWFIPLADGTTSVGAVCRPHYIKSRKIDLSAFFLQTISLCPEIATRLEHATLVSPVTATGNYSYRAQRMTGPSFILVGDAFAFLDPVFSSGVYLAMMSAFHGAEAVETVLSSPKDAARALKRFETAVRPGLKSLSWFIYRIRTPVFRDLFMSPRNFFRMEEAVLSLLAGDVFGGSPIRSRLLIFKALYYFMSLVHLKSSLKIWVARRQDVRVSGTV
jgi:2-polyprenyl-6-methoxyphenol hydroxylase-like FAD-dependent oxidoreductase